MIKKLDAKKRQVADLYTLYHMLLHTGADLLPDTDFNLPLPMRSEICLMINFNL